MIPDLLSTDKIARYIHSQTGTMLTPEMIQKLLKAGEIAVLRKPGTKQRFTTKQAVNAFIERNTEKDDDKPTNSEKLGYADLCKVDGKSQTDSVEL